ncbi:MAG: energy transducer TonB [Alphaproteobacteria bacterium]|nr:energy transducer TonB [Alphaproteobacteria bacterium]
MAGAELTREERWGLAISIVGHAAVLAILLLRPATDAIMSSPERVEVTISEDFGPTPPKPAPPKASAVDQVAAREPSRASPSTRPAPRSTSAAATPAKGATPPAKVGASRFTEAFGPGTPGATTSTTTGAPAATIGPQQISALNAAIGRQLRPHWRGKAPEGAEAELLVTRVRFRLNRDGSLAGEPQVLATTGQTEANQPQVARHQEQAVRAVKLAAPFDLPEDLYDGWKVVTTNFDRKLSQ